MSRTSIVLAAAALVLGVAGGIAAERLLLKAPQASADSQEKKIAYWVAPMDPNYRRDGPGKSPMGMDLIPVYEGADQAAATDDEAAVKVSPATRNSIGVRATAVSRGDFGTTVRTVGTVTLDEDTTSHIHVRKEGWIQGLAVRTLGAEVRKGDLLFSFFSQDLAAASWEYVRELQRGSAGMTQGAASKLRALGVSEQQIAEIRASGKPADLIRVYAPRDGVLVQLGVGEGMYIRPDQTLMTLSDLSSVWVIADVIESQSAQITPGMKAEVRLSHLPGSLWTGRVDYIYPELDPVTRTARVRLRFANKDKALRPNMFTDVTLQTPPRQNVLRVPTEAVIRVAGENRVILDQGEGRFSPQRVEIGPAWNGYTEIRKGLSEGQKVVTSAQFLIDSEASLTAGLARMEDPAEAPKPAPTLAPIAETEAIITALKVDQGLITVKHKPIPALGWPAMTMDFGLGPDIDPASVPAEGSTIQMGIARSDTGAFLAVSITPMEPKP